MSKAADAAQKWYHCDIDRKTLKQLMKRNDSVGLMWLGGHFACLIGSGAVAYYSLGTWFVVPAFLVYGIIHGFLEAPLHEMHHGTVFRTRWINEVFHTIVAYLVMKEPVYDRWAHTYHHTFTAFDDDDEIEAPCPISIAQLLRNLFAVDFMLTHPPLAIRHAFGLLSEHAKDVVPEPERRKVIWSARGYVACYGGIILWSVIGQTWLPVVFAILPRIYGRGLGMYLVGLTQHAAMADHVWDHRLNTRTFIGSPLTRFFYWNMNYHIEHHMFPQVPFHALPRLHDAVKNQMPKPFRGVLDCYREIIPAILRQRREPAYVIRPNLPVSG